MSRFPAALDPGLSLLDILSKKGQRTVTGAVEKATLFCRRL